MTAYDGATRDPVIRLLMDTIDASPRGEWLTSNQRLREAERIVAAIRRSGREIVRSQPASVEVEPAMTESQS